MADSLHEFVAEEAWLAVAVLTVPLGVLAGTAGLEAVADAIFTAGFLLFTPLLLFWGEEIADALLGPRPADDDAGDAHGDSADGTAHDPLAELKRRYASGELDDEEFEARVERLVALEDVDASGVDREVLLGDDGRGDGSAGADGADAVGSRDDAGESRNDAVASRDDGAASQDDAVESPDDGDLEREL